MADYGTVKQALADALDASPDLTVVYPSPPDVYVTPCAVLTPGDNPATYHGSMSGQGFTVFEFKVQVMVQRFDMEHTISVLDKYVHGPDSVDALVRADLTLGGVAATCIVRRCSNIGQVLSGDEVYLGAEFEVEVMVAP